MTVTLWVAADEFPLWSVAVYVMVVVLTANKLLGGTPVTVIDTPEQLSVADAVPRAVTIAPQDVAPGPVNAVNAAGAVIFGASVSLTVTWNEQDEELPAWSVAVQVT